MTKLTEQLKNIKVEPSLEWQTRTRNFLLSEIRKTARQLPNQIISEQRGRVSLGLKISNQKIQAAWQTERSGWVVNFINSFRVMRLAWRPASIVALAAIFVLGGSGILTVAARQAVPGEKLFAVKRAWEKINDYMVTDAAHKTELASAVLETRVNDLQKVLEQESRLVAVEQNTGEDKTVIAAVGEVKKQIKEVNDKFEAMKDKDKENGQKMAATALALNEKIRTYKEDLKAAKDQVADSETNKELDEALNKVEDINSEVLSVLVDKHSKGELAVAEDDLAMRVQEHLKQAEVKIDEAAGALQEVTKDENEALAVKVDEAKEVIKKANEALDKNEYSLVLTLTKDSNKILEMIFGSIYELKRDDGAVKGAATEAAAGEDAVIPAVVETKTSTTTDSGDKLLPDAEKTGTEEVEKKEEAKEIKEFQVNILQ
ncbi:hypothetical protein A3E04_02715 [Candidatus Kuenenbacteria bacterium RIFCSPHIGHO2_12_FULL_42_14]|uniref:DUF5667 domain-containing protein n=1 Tax=Candidatus Kuenenbacteria bacterium RIFCSPHIGHO2_12_FULL_42_14 TaxID=1798563 RepID=A0A1F6GK70_9BACT|nr:MAG: hypothetical protein A3E04_02715 [Candidatus Kuenenbacteria bacterium RIFCSPHIGHO2_12_FULL_42_14]